MANFGTLLCTFGVNNASASASNVAIVSSGSGLVQAGDLVFALFYEQTNLTQGTVSDSMGHSYTATNIGTDAGSLAGRAYYTRITSNGTLTSLTGAATSSTDNIIFIAASFAGPFDTTPVDANIANTTTGSAGAVYTCPATGVLAKASEVVIAWGVRSSGTAFTATSPNLIAIQMPTVTVGQAVIGYQVTINTSSLAPVFTSSISAGASVLGTTTFQFTNDVLLGQGIF